MSLIQKIDQDIKEALKAGQKEKLIVLRGLKSSIKYKQIDKGEDLTDPEVIDVLGGVAKKCRESIEQFAQGSREDLVAKEKSELELISSYLPEQLPEEKLREIIKSAITESGADSAQKVGLVMKLVIPQVKGKADGKLVNKLAMELLTNQS